MTVQELFQAAQALSLSDQIHLASQIMQSVAQELKSAESPDDKEAIKSDSTVDDSDDPLIGLFSGSPELAEQSKRILEHEIESISGFTWKKS